MLVGSWCLSEMKRGDGGGVVDMVGCSVQMCWWLGCFE